MMPALLRHIQHIVLHLLKPLKLHLETRLDPSELAEDGRGVGPPEIGGHGTRLARGVGTLALELLLASADLEQIPALLDERIHLIAYER